MITGVPGLEEREWEGSRLRIGEVVIGVEDLRARCIMTTFDPDTIAPDSGVLRDIVKRFGGKLALNRRVLNGGVVGVGRDVEDYRNRLRFRYRPERLRLLFIGEAPPASGRFFYRGDSGLYRAIRDAFRVVDPSFTDEAFLPVFQSSGCYLIDLCPDPVDRLDRQSRREACVKKMNRRCQGRSKDSGPRQS